MDFFYVDCCDGSDEWANLNGVSCPNNCKELAREAWKVTLEQIEVTKKGLQKKKKMIDQAQGKWSEMNAKVQLLDTELKQLQAQVDQLISLRKEEEERIESERAKAVEEELHANPREDQSVDEQGTVMDESEVSPDEAEENNVGDNADESFPYPKEYRFDEDSEAYDDVDVDDLDENDEDGLDEFDTAGENGLDEIDAHTDSISDEITIDVPRNTEDEPGKSIFDKLMDSAYSLFSRITGSGTSDHKDNCKTFFAEKFKLISSH